MLIQLSSCIKVIRPESRAIFPYSNSLYVDDEEQVLIDAGAGRAYQDIPAEKIQKLIFSHYHFDHIHGWTFFPQASKLAGEEERWAFEDEEQFNLSAGYQFWEELMGVKKDSHWGRSINLPEDVHTRPGFQNFGLDATFKDGETINTGKTSMIALHTPGHTPGHYAFYFPNENILFSADLDLSPRGPWYGGAFADFDDLVNSVQRLIALNPAVLVTSHRRIFEGDVRPLLEDYINIALEREKKILEFLEHPRYFTDIASLSLFGPGDGSQHEDFWARMMIKKHLDRCVKHKWIEQMEDGRYRRV